MDVLARLNKLMEERGWSEYRLATLSGLSPAAIGNIFRRNALPSIPTLEAICKACGITLAQFFAEDDLVEVTPEVKTVLDLWAVLTPEHQELALKMIQALTEND